jgi:concanavalin A-like lectin/glucanase superfamily protein
MTPLVDYKLPAVGGSFAMTGQAASLVHAWELAAASGSFAVTGQDATLTYAGGFTAVAVNFDGTNDYLTSSGLSGAVDGRKGIVSFWYQLNGGDGVDLRIFGTSASGSGRFALDRHSSNLWRFTMRNSAGTDLITGTPFQSSTGKVAGAGWHHFIASWDLDAGVTSLQLYIDGSSDRSGTPTVTAGDIDYATNQASVGGTFAGASKLNADLSELYVNLTESIDLSVAANVQKWRTTGGKPENLGANGSTPTGTQPAVYLANALATWETNLGSGAGFTETGALTSSSTSPSD